MASPGSWVLHPGSWVTPWALALCVGTATTSEWRADATLFSDRYSSDRTAEQQLDLSLGRKLPNRWTPVGALSYQHRYEQVDVRGEAWLYTPGIGPVYGWIMGGATHDADFLARHLAEAGLEGEFATGTGTVLRARWLDHGDERIWMLWAVARQQLGPIQVEAGRVWSLSSTEPSVGTWQAAVRPPAIGPLRLRAYVSAGEENNPPLPIGEVFVLGLQGWWRLSPTTTLRGELSWEDREDLYERVGFGLGGTWRF